MPESVSNADLKEQINGLSDGLAQHAIDDAQTFVELRTKMDSLATKDDIKEMKEVFKDFVTAMQVSRNIGKFLFRVLLILGAIATAIIAIIGGIKAFFSLFR